MAEAPRPAVAPAAPTPARPGSWSPFLLLVAAILVLTGLAVLAAYRQTHEREAVRLEAIAKVRAEQVSNWLRVHVAAIEFVRGSPYLANLYRRWHERGDGASREQLFAGLREFLVLPEDASLLVVEPNGKFAHGGAGSVEALPPNVLATAQLAMATGRVQRSELYRVEGDSAPHLDIVAPLVRSAPARGAIDLRVDAHAGLTPMLKSWPVPSATAESLIVRRAGDRIHGVFGSAGAQPVATSDVLAARVLRGEYPAGTAVDAKDDSGRAVLGVVQPVAGTDWYLVTKIDRRDLYALTLQQAIWIIAVGGLAVFASWFVLRLLRERSTLRMALAERAQQEEKLRALALLDAIAENSTDAIFAKDREGRYLLFNRAACLQVGRTREQAIGRDDRALYPSAEAAHLMAQDRRVMESDESITSEEVLTGPGGRYVAFTTKGPLHDSEGNVVGVFGISREVTERYRAETQLRESRQRLELALTAAHMGVWEWNLETGTLYCSPEVRTIFGVGDTIADDQPLTIEMFKRRIHRDDLERFERDAAQAIATNTPYAAECRIVLPGGNVRWISIMGRPAYAANGEPLRGFGVVLDIDDRKRVEVALRESADFVRAVGDSMQDHMAVLDRYGKIVSVNAAWQNFAIENGQEAGAAAPDTGVGVDYLEVCRAAAQAHDASAYEAYDGIRAVLAGERVNFRLEYPCHSPAVKRWFLMKVTPLETGAGGVVVIHTNITERVLADQAVRESEANYRSMVSALSEGVVVFGANGEVRACNPSAERILGVTLTDMRKGRQPLAAWRPVRPDGTPYAPSELPVAQTLATGESRHGVVLGDVAPTGRVSWLSVNSEPIIDDICAAPTGAVVSFTDITQRFRAEGELRKLSLAVEQSPESIVITDVDGRIEYVNEAFTRASGYTRDEVLGANPRILQSGLTPRAAYESLWQTLAAGRSWSGEFVNRRKNGETFVEIAHISPVRHDGRVTHYVAIKEDISERKKLESELDRHRDHLEELVAERTRELQAANVALTEAQALVTAARDKAEAASRAKSAFLANVSHEIRTPMNAIVGLAYLIRRDTRDPQQLERLAKVTGATNHLLELINDVLDLSKIEAGKLGLEHTDFSLDALVARTTALVADRVRAKGIELVIEKDGVANMLRGDPTRLSQALLNLLDNAVKFTTRGSIRVRCDVLETTDQGWLLRFSVRDTGIGIAPDKLASIFDAFEQADTSTTRRFGGTGLGLAITRHLAALMGGAAGAESEPGAGSTFWFTARLGRGAEPPAIAPDEGAELALRRECGGARVLLAEDNEINREVAVEILRAAELEVDVATNGAEAIDMASRVAYDAILLDVQMPEVDGLAAARAIRALPAHARTPILALTANVFAEDYAACVTAGMNDHVAKPVDPHHLYTTLLRWLAATGAARDAALAGPAQARGRVPGDAASAGEPPVPVAADPRDVEALLDQLESLLAEGDFAAAGVARECANVLGEHAGERARLFETLVGSYDYPQALALLRDLRSRMRAAALAEAPD